MSRTLKQRQKVTKRKHGKGGNRTKKLRGGGLYCDIKNNSCYDGLNTVRSDIIKIYDPRYDAILNKLIKQSVSKKVTAKQLFEDDRFSSTKFSRREASSLAQTLQHGFLNKYGKRILEEKEIAETRSSPLMSEHQTSVVSNEHASNVGSIVTDRALSSDNGVTVL